MALRAVIDHPKFFELKKLIVSGRGITLGYLEATWHFAGRFTPQGNIGKYTDGQIESWVEWHGEPGALVAALVASRWLDKDAAYRLLVHDWPQHADKATKNALVRAKLQFCTPTPSVQNGDMSVQNGDMYSENALPYGLPVPEPVPVPEPGAGAGPYIARSENRHGAQLRVLVVEDDWPEFLARWQQAGLPCVAEDLNEGRHVWSTMDFKARLTASQSLLDRTLAGEFDDPAFHPLPKNFLRVGYKRPVRNRAGPSGGGATRRAAARFMQQGEQ